MFIDSPISADVGLISDICGGGRVQPGDWLPRMKTRDRKMRERVSRDLVVVIFGVSPF